MNRRNFPTTIFCLAALLLGGCDQNRVTAENAALLKPGMPVASVKEILGERNFGRSWGESSETYTYQAEKLWVRVEAREGKITQVLTRDTARTVAQPTRNNMPVLDLTNFKVREQMDATLQRGGPPALASWIQQELVPGRPVLVHGGREALLADRFLVPLDAANQCDYSQPLVAPQTDEHVWFTTFSSAMSLSFRDREPALQAHILVTRK